MLLTFYILEIRLPVFSESIEEIGGLDQKEDILLAEAFQQNDKDPTALLSRYYILANSTVPEVNGRYMPSGYYNGSPFYRNVREWALVRCTLDEIPELGITAENSYAMQEGTSISEMYHQAAGNNLTAYIYFVFILI